MYSSPLDNTGLNCMGSLTRGGFPNDLSSSNLCCSRVNSEAGNPNVQSAECNYTRVSDCVELRAPNPALFKGQLYHPEGLTMKKSNLFPKENGSSVVIHH